MIIVFSILALALLLGAIQALLRSLPAQNVSVIVGGLLLVEMVLEAEQAWFGPFWRAVSFWPAIIIWARVLVRWFLRRRRQDWNYGIWLIFIASAAVAMIQFALALTTADAIVALKTAAFRFAIAGGSLLLLTPWFISKLPEQPEKHA
jgi:hypothetical protein